MNRIFAAALLSLLCLNGCTMDHLYYASSDTATVLVQPNWENAGLEPNGVTVFAYRDSDGSLYRRFPPVSASEKCYIKLPEGDFSLVVMNDTPEEFGGNMVFTGEENISTFQARGVKDENKSSKLEAHLEGKSSSEGSDYCIVDPSPLALSVVRGIHISPEQIDYYYDRPQNDINAAQAIEVKTEQRNVISTVSIKAHVKGLKYARGTTLCYLRGVAAGHCMGLGVNSPDAAAQGFILNNRAFDPGSDSDGTIRASFPSFGLIGDGKGDGKYYLDINFVLINGQAYPLTFDVTELLSVDVSLSLQLSLNVDLEIELPEVVGDEGGGFNTDINDWMDETVDIPM